MPNLVKIDELGLPIYDFSDEIAHLQCLILSLSDLAPGGQWVDLPIYQRWRVRASRQAITYKELLTLTDQLEAAIAAA